MNLKRIHHSRLPIFEKITVLSPGGTMAEAILKVKEMNLNCSLDLFEES